jgi:hypothetical protein
LNAKSTIGLIPIAMTSFTSTVLHERKQHIATL